MVLAHHRSRPHRVVVQVSCRLDGGEAKKIKNVSVAVTERHLSEVVNRYAAVIVVRDETMHLILLTVDSPCCNGCLPQSAQVDRRKRDRAQQIQRKRGMNSLQEKSQKYKGT